MLRDAGSGSSGHASNGGGSRGRTHGCHHRQPDLAIHAGEWPARDTTGTNASAARNFTWRLIRSGICWHCMLRPPMSMIVPRLVDRRSHPERYARERHAGLRRSGLYWRKGRRRGAFQGYRNVCLELPEAKRGFVLISKRWKVERSSARTTRCQRLVKNYQGYASTFAGPHVVAFVCLLPARAAVVAQSA